MPIRFMVESISPRRSWASSIGGTREVAALDAGAVADVAASRTRRPCSRRRRSPSTWKRHLVRRRREADVVEDEELGLGAAVGRVADAGRLEVGLGLDARCRAGRAHRARWCRARPRCSARRSSSRRRTGRRRPRSASGISFMSDWSIALPAGDRGAVEHEALLDEVRVDEVGDHGHVLELAARVGEADVDVGDLVVLRATSEIELLVSHLVPSLSSVRVVLAGRAPRPVGVRRVRGRRRPSSPVRMRIACSTGMTKILPSPILSVLAALMIASMARVDLVVGAARPRSSPWAGSRRRTRRRDRARCGPSGGRSP